MTFLTGKRRNVCSNLKFQLFTGGMGSIVMLSTFITRKQNTCCNFFTHVFNSTFANRMYLTKGQFAHLNVIPRTETNMVLERIASWCFIGSTRPWSALLWDQTLNKPIQVLILAVMIGKLIEIIKNALPLCFTHTSRTAILAVTRKSSSLRLATSGLTFVRSVGFSAVFIEFSPFPCPLVNAPKPLSALWNRSSGSRLRAHGRGSFHCV